MHSTIQHADHRIAVTSRMKQHITAVRMRVNDKTQQRYNLQQQFQTVFTTKHSEIDIRNKNKKAIKQQLLSVSLWQACTGWHKTK